MKYTIYNNFGTICRYVDVIDSAIDLQLQEKEFYIEGYVDSSYYIDISTLEPIKIPLQPNQYAEFNWETKQWENPIGFLDTAKNDYKLDINRLAGDKILSQYPTYRQINYNRDPTAQATIDMNLWIDGIRAESNIATSSIDLATDLATIEGIVEGFKVYLAGL